VAGIAKDAPMSSAKAKNMVVLLYIIVMQIQILDVGDVPLYVFFIS
jgi:hypothetical protein